MLNNYEIEDLIESGYFRILNLDFDNSDSRTMSFKYNMGKDEYYCFSDPAIDQEVYEFVIDYINSLFEDFLRELEPEINNKVSLSLPSPDCRLKILEESFHEHVSQLKSKISDWEFSVLSEEYLFENIKYSYRRSLDKILNCDAENDKLFIATSLHLLKGDDLYRDILSDTQNLNTLKRVKWLREQIIIENQKINRTDDFKELKGINNTTNSDFETNKKIKWLGNSSHLGYIIYQLAEKGFIEFPNYNGEINYTGLAERVLNGFEIKDKHPSKKYLSEQINPDSENNKISESTKNKLKINIRDLSDLS